MQKYNKHKNQYEKVQQTNKSFAKLYRKSLKDNVIDKIKYESPCIFLLSIWMKQKKDLYHKYEYKKLSFFSNSEVKFNLGPRTWNENGSVQCQCELSCLMSL